MSFDWDHYLDVAKYLTGDTTIHVDEAAKLRSAISRAYYAIFNSAVQYMEKKNNIRNLGENSHKVVQEWFEKSAIEEKNQIGQNYAS